MSALLAYTTNPTPAILARFNTRYQLAAAEWNDAVKTELASGPPSATIRADRLTLDRVIRAGSKTSR